MPILPDSWRQRWPASASFTPIHGKEGQRSPLVPIVCYPRPRFWREASKWCSHCWCGHLALTDIPAISGGMQSASRGIRSADCSSYSSEDDVFQWTEVNCPFTYPAQVCRYNEDEVRNCKWIIILSPVGVIMFLMLAVSSLVAVVVLVTVAAFSKYQAFAVVRKIPGPTPGILFGNALQLPSTPDGKWKAVSK